MTLRLTWKQKWIQGASNQKESDFKNLGFRLSNGEVEVTLVYTDNTASDSISLSTIFHFDWTPRLSVGKALYVCIAPVRRHF